MILLFLLIAFMIGIAVGAIIIWKFMDKVVFSVEKLSEKHAALFRVMRNWVYNYQNGKTLSEYLIQNKFNTIAIYGLGNLGETLYNELCDSDIRVIYGIDQSVEFFGNIPVYKKTDFLPDVDLIIVTAITSYKEVERELRERIGCKIISIEELVLML